MASFQEAHQLRAVQVFLEHTHNGTPSLGQILSQVRFFSMKIFSGTLFVPATVYDRPKAARNASEHFS